MSAADKITIRQAQTADIDTLLLLLQILFGIEEDFSFDKRRQQQGLTLMINNSRAVVLVAEENEIILGMCSGQLMISTAEGGSTVLVEDVVVLPGHRGRGVGRLLMDSISSWGKENHASRLQLLADRNNEPALGFYRKLDWQSTELICLRKK